MGYANGRPTASGPFSQPNDRQVREANDTARAESNYLAGSHAPAAIVAEYHRAVRPVHQGTGLERGLGMTDQEAFDQAIRDHGFGNAVKALKTVSARAKQRDDAHQARKGRRP
jgi:hypothetical protein